MTQRLSRVPPHLKDDGDHYAFLDSIDRRQLTLGQLQDLSVSASTTDIIEKINAILASHRTK